MVTLNTAGPNPAENVAAAEQQTPGVPPVVGMQEPSPTSPPLEENLVEEETWTALAPATPAEQPAYSLGEEEETWSPLSSIAGGPPLGIPALLEYTLEELEMLRGDTNMQARHISLAGSVKEYLGEDPLNDFTYYLQEGENTPERVEAKLYNLPKSLFNAEAISNALNGLPTVIGAAGGESTVSADSVLKALSIYQISPSVLYNRGAPISQRSIASHMNTMEEEVGYWASVYGEENVSVDPANRILYRAGPDSPWATVDELDFTLSDIADISADLMEGTALALAVLLGPQTGYVAMAAMEMAAGVTYRSTSALVQEASGLNKESAGELGMRFSMESGLDFLGFNIGLGISSLFRYWKAPVSSSMSQDNIDFKETLDTFDKEKRRLLAEEGRLSEYKKTKTLTANLVDSKFIRKMTGYLGNMPFAGAFQKRIVDKLENDVLFVAEAYFKKHHPGGSKYEYNVILSEMLERAMERRRVELRSVNSIKGDTIPSWLGSKRLASGLQESEVAWKIQHKSSYDLLDSYLGENTLGSAVFPTKEIKGYINDVLSAKSGGIAIEEEVVREGSKVLNQFGAQMIPDTIDVVTKQSRITLTKATEDALTVIRKDLKDIASFEDIRALKNSIGEKLKKISTNDVQEGILKDLYRSIKDAEQSAAVKASLVSKFIKGNPGASSKDVDDFLALFEMTNEKSHEMFKIFYNTKGIVSKIRALSEIPGGVNDLVPMFFVGGREADVSLIKEILSPKDWKEFVGAAQTYLLDSKNGTEMVDLLTGKKTKAVMEITFGSEKYGSLVKFSKEILQLEGRPAAALLRHHQQSMKLFKKLVIDGGQGTAAALVDTIKLLGSDSKSIKTLQLVFMQELLRKSAKSRGENLVSIDGDILRNLIQNKYGSYEDIKLIFKGTDMLKNLEVIADISANASKSDTGSIASSMMLADMLTSFSILSSGSNVLKFYVAARMLESPAAQKWFTNKPLSDLTATKIRAFTEFMIEVSTDMYAETQVDPIEALIDETVRGQAETLRLRQRIKRGRNIGKEGTKVMEDYMFK